MLMNADWNRHLERYFETKGIGPLLPLIRPFDEAVWDCQLADQKQNDLLTSFLVINNVFTTFSTVIIVWGLDVGQSRIIYTVLPPFTFGALKLESTHLSYRLQCWIHRYHVPASRKLRSELHSRQHFVRNYFHVFTIVISIVKSFKTNRVLLQFTYKNYHVLAWNDRAAIERSCPSGANSSLSKPCYRGYHRKESGQPWISVLAWGSSD